MCIEGIYAMSGYIYIYIHLILIDNDYSQDYFYSIAWYNMNL